MKFHVRIPVGFIVIVIVLILFAISGCASLDAHLDRPKPYPRAEKQAPNPPAQCPPVPVKKEWPWKPQHFA